MNEGESLLYGGMQGLSGKADQKLLELPRIALASFELIVANRLHSSKAACDVLSLKFSQQYCVDKTLVLSDEPLGQLRLLVKGAESFICASDDMRDLGCSLSEIIRKFETVPSPSGVAQCAIHKVDYFSRIIDEHGVPYAPQILLTYRTGDPESRKLLARLTGQPQ